MRFTGFIRIHYYVYLFILLFITSDLGTNKKRLILFFNTSRRAGRERCYYFSVLAAYYYTSTIRRARAKKLSVDRDKNKTKGQWGRTGASYAPPPRRRGTGGGRTYYIIPSRLAPRTDR